MPAIPLLPAAAVAWLAACLTVLVVVLVRRKRRRGILPEDGFFIGGMSTLSVAPGVSLLDYMEDSSDVWSGGVPFVVGIALILGSVYARRRRIRGTIAGSMTFREKSAMLVLGTLCFVFASYFAKTWNATLETAIPAFIGAIVLIVVIMIVGHVLISIFHAPLEELEEVADERDRQAGLLSTRNAYYVLGLGIWIVPVLAILSMTPLIIANTALALVVLSQIVKYGSLVVYYRFGTP